jgi:hypothetical protein
VPVKRLIVAACVLALVVAMGCERVVDLTSAPADSRNVDAFDHDAFHLDATPGDGFNGDDGDNDGGIENDVGGPSDV